MLLRERQIRGQYDNVPVEPRLDRLWPDAALPPPFGASCKERQRGARCNIPWIFTSSGSCHGHKPVYTLPLSRSLPTHVCPGHIRPQGHPDSRSRRLEAWKEIASYLGRDVTTVVDGRSAKASPSIASITASLARSTPTHGNWTLGATNVSRALFPLPRIQIPCPPPPGLQVVRSRQSYWGD